MKDTKLIRTLKTFTKDELKLFEKFIASPFFNKGRNYQPLLAALKKFYPDFNKDILTSEFIYKKIYPARKFNKQVMWNLVSELEKLAIEFLLQISLKKNRTHMFTLMFDELSGRRLIDQVSKEIYKMEKYAGSVKLGKENLFANRMLANYRVEYFSNLIGRQDKISGLIVNSSEYLLLNFLADLSVEVSDIQLMRRMYGFTDDLKTITGLICSLELKKMIDLASLQDHKHSELMTFYYNKIMSALSDDENHFYEMKKYFEKNFDRFEMLEQKNTIISLANYCAHKMRMGNEKFLRTLFELNKFRLEKEIDTQQNRILEKSLYYQIIKNALTLNEIEWAEKFVKEYTPKLKKEQQEAMNSLALGNIYFAKREYEKALSYLNKIEFIDIRDKLHVRILSAKAYYELGQSELLFYNIDSSKHFISKNKEFRITSKEPYLKFFNYLNRLLLHKENSDTKKLKSLKYDIELDKNFLPPQDIWLLEKIDIALSQKKKN